ncbi:MAG: ASKHA domain-containing protein, partial [Thermoanaerobacteraceae bacterium]|nr:ASKHA domain-containing protein [Thermoanaerobacteraceae bacterium]
RKIYVELAAPRLGDNQADADRLLTALPAAAEKAGTRLVAEEVAVPLPVLRRLPEVLRAAGWRVTAALGRTEGGWRLQDVTPGDTAARQFGLAVDAGTTTVAAAVVDLLSGTVLGAAAGENAQVAVGEDILTRLFTAAEPDGLAGLQRLLAESINRTAAQAVAEARVGLGEITAVAVGANTALVHFLLGLDPANLYREPYIPAVNAPGFFRAADLGLAVHPEAVVYCLPGIGSYFGGDAVAGVFVSGMNRQEELSLFVDIGTNGEMAIGNREWLVAAAGAAGPAFESGVVADGMRAAPGAVERVQIEPDTHKVQYNVIGGGKAQGLCGSAVVDALAGMLLAGIIDRAGCFRDGREAFVVVSGSETASGEDIVITQQDIKSFLKTKGAVNAAVETLLAAVGVQPQEIGRFYAAGAFGEHLDVEAAVTIGLYPDLPRDRIVLLGNSSLEGARRALVSEEARQELKEICCRVTYFELNASADFMARFAGSQFFPHTDLSLYPTVAEKLRAAELLKT